MSLQDGKWYDATVTGAEWMESNSGTPGLQIFLDTEEGESYDTVLWFTAATISNGQTVKTLTEVLGADASRLQDEAYIDRVLPSAVAGALISFQAKAETYNGVTKVKVGFIRKRRITGASGPASAAARLLGAKPVAQQDNDDDIPF